ncbi:MAG TPA: YbhB/YbcL family Raf kinase inhibitor-like protein [Planctomycetaceae bacterium]|nr:YbhB/YbcL family Raf kinase inhibitor-like protein [Planctomycetaceae bacterium]
MKLHSTAFAHEATIPTKHTGEGADASPPLAWSEVPSGTKSFTLICDDPDAPSRKRPAPQPWVHWVIYNIPVTVTSLPERVARSSKLNSPIGACQGHNSWPSDNVGYLGPMPPPGSGPHRYFFKLYALDTELNVSPEQATKLAVLDAMQGHVLAVGELIGTYERK